MQLSNSEKRSSHTFFMYQFVHSLILSKYLTKEAAQTRFDGNSSHFFFTFNWKIPWQSYWGFQVEKIIINHSNLGNMNLRKMGLKSVNVASNFLWIFVVVNEVNVI